MTTNLDSKICHYLLGAWGCFFSSLFYKQRCSNLCILFVVFPTVRLFFFYLEEGICYLCEIKMVNILICFLFCLCKWNCQVPHPYLWVQGPLLPVWTLRPFAFQLFLHMIALSHGKDLITWYDWLVFLTELLCAITLNRWSELQDWPFCLHMSPNILFNQFSFSC